MSEAPPSLASLRRQRSLRRRPELSGPAPGLFDTLPFADEASTAPQQPLQSAISALGSDYASQATATAGTRNAELSPEAARDVISPARATASPPRAGTASGPEVVDRAPLDVPSPDPSPPALWTVSGLVRHVRGLVERGYARVTVEGEISNWRPSGSGHCYFTLKDSGAQLSAVLFRRQASLMRFQPRDGDAVKLHGQLSVFESRGQMQLIVEWMQQAGLGALLAEVQRLKDRLRSEGLFDRKRPLPPFPRCIGVVTSLQGAALRDIVKVCRRRHAGVRLLVYPAAVQGPNCALEVVAGIRWFTSHPDQAEVVLVARGGGSWEDLHGFDDERIARAIAASIQPVVTGIGHATDTTIADAAADLCAPTPSAAAELLTAAQHRVEERLEALQGRLNRAGKFNLLRAQQRLGRLGAQTVLRRVQDGLDRRAQALDELTFRAQTALNRRVRSFFNRQTAADGRLARHNPATELRNRQRRQELLQQRLQQAAKQRLNQLQSRIEAAHVRLLSLSPLRVLDRGYALVYGADGKLLRDAQTASSGQHIRARLAKGILHAQVLPEDLPTG